MIFLDRVVAGLAFGLMALLRRLDPKRSSAICGRILRRLGVLIPVSNLARKNLALAFPEKTRTERENILKGVWENLGCVAGEFIHLDRLVEITQIDEASLEIIEQLKSDDKPALIFTAHLANWELPAIIAHKLGLATTALYRPPNNAFLDRATRKIRKNSMGHLQPSGRNAPLMLARDLKKGRHVGMLIDQHLTKGVEVMFFGRLCKANPTLARLARQFECPVHGARIIRLTENRFRLELSERIILPRDADDKIDIQTTMQLLTTHIETWVREYPDQWLWLHKRWKI